jgi:hypothetical protein
VIASKRDLADLLRSVGGVLFAVGAVVLLTRKSQGHQWSQFARLLVVMVPAVALYLMAIVTPKRTDSETGEPWRSVLLVTATLTGLVALLEFMAWVGAGGKPLALAAVFLLTGLLAAYGGYRARVPYAALLSALAVLVAWLIVWNKIFHPSADGLRVVLLVGALLLLLASVALARTGSIGAGEVATAGGAAAVTVGVLGVIVGFVAAAFQSVVGISEGTSSSGTHSNVSLGHGLLRPPHTPGSGLPSLVHTNGLQHFGWDLYLLAISVGLLWVGSRVRVRGLGYVGAIGVLAFLVSVGTQLTRLESGHSPSTSIVGWPLALLVVGLGALAASTLDRRRAS